VKRKVTTIESDEEDVDGGEDAEENKEETIGLVGPSAVPTNPKPKKPRVRSLPMSNKCERSGQQFLNENANTRGNIMGC
jgi:hypothetical protein